MPSNTLTELAEVNRPGIKVWGAWHTSTVIPRHYPSLPCAPPEGAQHPDRPACSLADRRPGPRPLVSSLRDVDYTRWLGVMRPRSREPSVFEHADGTVVDERLPISRRKCSSVLQGRKDVDSRRNVDFTATTRCCSSTVRSLGRARGDRAISLGNAAWSSMSSSW